MRLDEILKLWKARKQRDSLYATAAYWDSKAVDYEGHAVSMWPNNHLNRFYHGEQRELLDQMLPSVEGRRLLDLGCGTGRNSRYFAKLGAKVTGVDFSGKAIELARRQTTADNPRYRQQSLFDLEDRDAYDIVLTWAVLTMACRTEAEILDVLKRLRRSLAPGGTALICEPIHKGPLHRVLNMNIRDFLKEMRQAGFRVQDVKHLHFWPMRVLLAYIQWPLPITAAAFYAGRAAMSLLGHRRFGDYKVILAHPA
jgi:2-polyprenyl-3-methyl-5-hydroxy-6-metoxy-1,4-benzoquinol methylase